MLRTATSRPPVFPHLFRQLLTALLCELREGQTDDAAVVLRMDAKVRGLDGLFNALQYGGIPGLNDQRTRIGVEIEAI
jgi:hypothetical protein